MGSGDDSLDMGTGERMSGLATAKGSSVKHKLTGEAGTERGADYTVDPGDVRDLVAEWPKAPRDVAEKLLDHYGPPNEATPTRLLWYRSGPWRRILLTSDEVVHNFPTPHTDFLTQYIDYRVPPEKASELQAFDGSVLIDRTAGEMGARCDHEAYNILTLNLAHEIITGHRTVEEAREVYAESAAAFVMGRDAPYAERLLFDPPQGETADPDEDVIGSAMASQTIEKVKDAFTSAGGRTPPG